MTGRSISFGADLVAAALSAGAAAGTTPSRLPVAGWAWQTIGDQNRLRLLPAPRATRASKPAAR